MALLSVQYAKIISVSLLVRVQGAPEECPLWTRLTGVSLYLPCPEMYVSRADSRRLTPKLLAKT